MYEIVFKQKLSLGHMLIIARNLYINHFKSIARISLLVNVPIAILYTLIYGYIQNNSLLARVMENPLSVADITMDGELEQLLLYGLVILLISYMLAPLEKMAVALIAVRALKGEIVNHMDIFVSAFSKMKALFLASCIHILSMFLTVSFVIPALILNVLFCFYIYAIVLKDTSGPGSLIYSARTVLRKNVPPEQQNTEGNRKNILVNFFKAALYMIVIFSFECSMTMALDILLFFVPYTVKLLIISVIKTYFYVVYTIWFLNLDTVKA